MDVTEKHVITADHSIEWGTSTWDMGVEPSIRSRYTNSIGGFNHAGSSEVPWRDFIVMIEESIKRDKFSTSEISNILKTIADNCIK